MLSIAEDATNVNERKLPEGHHRIDMTVDLHTAVIVMIFAVSMIVSKIVPLFLYLSFSHLFFTPQIFNLDLENHLNNVLQEYIRFIWGFY